MYYTVLGNVPYGVACLAGIVSAVLIALIVGIIKETKEERNSHGRKEKK